MKDCTAFRLAMLSNGFQPTLNNCKRAIDTGWPSLVVDEAEIRSLDRSVYTSTGLKVDGDLAVFDIDVADAGLVDQLASVIGAQFPQLFTDGLVRHAGSAKEAWICWVDAPFGRRASRKWYRADEDPENPQTAKHQVECFGSMGARQVGVDGPHTRNQAGETVRTYQFTAGASPATRRRGELCVLPLQAFETACDEFDRIAAAAGLVMAKISDRRADGEERRFELDADTKIDVQGYGIMTVAKLERVARRNSGLRCSGSFHDPTRTRTDSHLIGRGRWGLTIWDAMTGVTWLRRERAPSETFLWLQELRYRSFSNA